MEQIDYCGGPYYFMTLIVRNDLLKQKSNEENIRSDRSLTIGERVWQRKRRF
jgi:hypothetical protein